MEIGTNIAGGMMFLSDDLVERTEKSVKLNNVSQLSCTDKKRYWSCEVTQENGGKFEGNIRTQDISIEGVEVDKVSSSANQYDFDFQGRRDCKLYKEAEVLRCK